jgi:hypothetical protein
MKPRIWNSQEGILYGAAKSNLTGMFEAVFHSWAENDSWQRLRRNREWR